MPGFNIRRTSIADPNQPFHTVETVRDHRWVLRDLGFAGLVTDTVAKTVSLPNIEFESQEIIGGFVYYKYAKAMKVGTFSISFYETLQTFEKLKAGWFDKVGNIREGIKAHDQYKKKVMVALIDGLGEDVYTVIFNGAWPKTLELGTLSYESSEIKLINVTCEFDFMTEKFGSSEFPMSSVFAL